MVADELTDLRERVVRLEAKTELNKRLDSVSKYLREILRVSTEEQRPSTF